jgi:WD40 repeat protein
MVLVGADGSVTGKHVYDLAWSPDSEFLIAGSTDNTASIWKAATGESFLTMIADDRRVRVCIERAYT